MRRSMVCAAVVLAACGPVRVVFPAGVPVAAPEAVSWWAEATEACRGASTFSAEITAGGRVGSEKLRHVTLQGAMTRAGGMRLVAVAPAGPPIFVLAGRADRATLTLPRDRRVVVAPSADIVDALIGLRLGPADWLDVLTGCVNEQPAAAAARVGDAIIVSLGDGTRVRLSRDGTSWRIAAGERPEVVVEYREFQGRWPRALRFASRSGAAVSINLNMGIRQVFVNSAIAARAFELDVPPGFSPMTLEELRATGPLGGGPRGGKD